MCRMQCVRCNGHWKGVALYSEVWRTLKTLFISQAFIVVAIGIVVVAFVAVVVKSKTYLAKINQSA